MVYDGDSACSRRRLLAVGLTSSAFLASCGRYWPGAPPLIARSGDGTDGPFDVARIEADLLVLDATTHLRTGSVGDLHIGELTQARLRAAGFDVQRQPFDAPFFEARASKLVWGEQSVDVFAQHPVVPTGQAGVVGAMRFWRPGDDVAPLKGAIAVVMLPTARHSQLVARPVKLALDAALSGRPIAVILVTDNPVGETIILNAPYDRPYATVPIAVIGPKPGAEAIAAARAGAKGKLVIDGLAGRRESYNVIARRSGEGRWLVVSTPRTAWTPAVAERGPGYASFLALAEWAPRAFPRRNLLFVQTTAHEFDNAGGRFFLESAAAPPKEDVALWAHLGAGFAGRAYHDLGGYSVAPLNAVDPARFLIGSDSLNAILRREFSGQPGLENAYPASAGAVGELAEVLERGYEPAFGLLGGHQRHHMMSDRIAATDAKWVREAAVATRNVIKAALSAAPI